MVKGHQNEGSKNISILWDFFLICFLSIGFDHQRNLLHSPREKMAIPSRALVNYKSVKKSVKPYLNPQDEVPLCSSFIPYSLVFICALCCPL